jgi:transposase
MLEGGMSGEFWLSEEQVERFRPHFPKVRGKPRVDDRRVLSGILHVLRNGLRWQDAPAVYGPHKTLYNRFARWSRLGVFARIFRDLAKPGTDGDTIMIDSTHLKAHRTAASLRKGGSRHARSGARKAA